MASGKVSRRLRDAAKDQQARQRLQMESMLGDLRQEIDKASRDLTPQQISDFSKLVDRASVEALVAVLASRGLIDPVQYQVEKHRRVLSAMDKQAPKKPVESNTEE